MSALAEALVAAQRRSLATLEKAYVAGAIEAEPCGSGKPPTSRPAGTKHKTKPATRALTASSASTERTCREPGASRLRVDARCLLLGFVARLEGDPPMSEREAAVLEAAREFVATTSYWRQRRESREAFERLAFALLDLAENRPMLADRETGRS